MGKFLNNIAGPLLGFGASIFQNAQNAKRQRQSFDQQKQLMGMQYANQRGLNYQGHELQYDMWQKTNYPAQMAMIKQAGLNPSLLYGQSGAGGATTGSQGGGSASGGSAPSPIPYDLGAGLTAMQTQAQIELAKSQAEKNKAEADKIKGVDTEKAQTEIDQIIANTDNTKAKTQLTNYQNELESYRSQFYLRNAANEADNLEYKVRLLVFDDYINQQTASDQIKQIRQTTVEKELANELLSSKIKLTDEQRKQIKEEIAQNWERISLTDTEVNIKIAQTIINAIGTVGGLVQANQLAKALQKNKKAQIDFDKMWGKGFKEGVESMKR